mmetsp:Transcript_4310/g.12159  ORF Transcript_4310/g.12159 Transcript_4310/m.12159 type:complete len:155 (+) Transcript_4310:629-1093(+)
MSHSREDGLLMCLTRIKSDEWHQMYEKIGSFQDVVTDHAQSLNQMCTNGVAKKYKSWNLVKVCGKQFVDPLYFVLYLTIDGPCDCIAATIIIEAAFAPYNVCTDAMAGVRCGANCIPPSKTLHSLQQQLLIPRTAAGVPWNEEKYRVRRVTVYV